MERWSMLQTTTGLRTGYAGGSQYLFCTKRQLRKLGSASLC